MENRELVVAEYFKLKLLLNRTNLVRDQKTEVIFEFIQKGEYDFGLIATLSGIYNPKHIELCATMGARGWRPSEYSGLYDLEEACATYLNEKKTNIANIESHQAAAKRLHVELGKLGIPR